MVVGVGRGAGPRGILGQLGQEPLFVSCRVSDSPGFISKFGIHYWSNFFPALLIPLQALVTCFLLQIIFLLSGCFQYSCLRGACFRIAYQKEVCAVTVCSVFRKGCGLELHPQPLKNCLEDRVLCAFLFK